MIRKKEDQTVAFRCVRNGNGDTKMCQILNSVEEMYGKGRMFNHMFLEPGNSLGEHTHNGDNEIFYILSGHCEYNDNGTIVELYPGDTAICSDGESHSMINNGDEPLEFIALILYS